MGRKHLSAIANDVLATCAQKLDTCVDSLIKDFERQWEPQASGYSRGLVEFCCSKAITIMCGRTSIDEATTNGSFSRFTFDMMLAWEMPNSADDLKSDAEIDGKQKEDKLIPIGPNEHDEIPLFYSDLMPLLVDGEASVGDDAFVWLGTLIPLAVDTVNGRFTFETLTASTGNRLHFPGYDKFLKEICKCIKHLKKQDTPKGIHLADDEFIMHVEGTLNSQRVVRHIGGTSWPGRLTLTNYALYFEASGIVSYEDALKLDLSKDTEQSVKPTATGPWGAPLFDKAIVYESSELEEGVVLEFPEITSSTRRDHWLALTKEVMLLHRFLSKFNVKSVLERWEMQARTILGIIRLHAAREMLRSLPPEPKCFLIFVLLDDLPKGDYVLQELAESLKFFTRRYPCTASSILKNLNVSPCCTPCLEAGKSSDKSEFFHPESNSSLEGAVNRAREEGREMDKAKATAVRLKEEGISESAQVLLGLLRPVIRLVFCSRQVFTWEQPAVSCIVIATSVTVIYKEWVGLALSAFLLCVVAEMLHARRKSIPEKQDKILIQTGGDQITMEGLVSAQQALKSIHVIMQLMNIAVLKIWSILISKAPKHTNVVMIVMACSAVVLVVVPLRFILIATVLSGFFLTSKLGKRIETEQGNRRLREWWNSIPIIPVEIVENKSAD